jgi:hypothetical protein
MMAGSSEQARTGDYNLAVRRQFGRGSRGFGASPFIALASAIVLGSAGPAAQAPRSPRNASYTIDARLDPAARTITGDELLEWRNLAPIAATELRFHLYYNAWRNTESTFMRERALAGDTSQHNRPQEDWSWIDVTSVQRLGAGGAGQDLTRSMRFISPDDGNLEDRTVVSIPIDRPVAPGETARVRLRWTSRVPRTFDRTGAVGDYFFLAQWFPKIGVLEPGGWNCHQFHSTTEFFADFGVYDVTLTVPRGWIVGATGRERERRDNADGTTTHRYYEEDVHDFAWTASPRFLERHARFEHPGLPPVDMRLLLQPEHASQEARHFDATRAALRYYGEWYAPYPYGHITIVDPAWRSGSGGMEYPTLFTGGTAWLTPQGVADPEDVLVHEAGHQFWYGMVANNEFEHAWLDEGLNSFSEARVLDVAYPGRHRIERFFGGFIPWVYRDIRLSRATDLNLLNVFRPNAESDLQALESYRYWPDWARTAGPITYAKTALWLHTLERHLGWPTLQRIMSTYFQRWAFRHPAPADFFAVANEVSGRDLTWFFDQVHRSSNAFDYAVARLTSVRSGGRGYVGDGGARAFRGAPPSGAPFETTVVLRRDGEATFPVDVRVTFEDGTHVRERWDGVARWHVLRYLRPARAVSAEVDPDRILLLDVSYTNNSRTLAPRGRAAATKWSLVWLTWFQDLLLTYGFLL